MSTPAAKVKALRKALNLRQVQLAHALGVAQSLISACEGGKTSPVELLLKLGNLAASSALYEDAFWFWESAGLDVQRVQRAAAELSKQHLRDMLRRPDAGGVISVPLLRDVRYAGSPSLAPPQAVERWVTLESKLVPRPASTCCMRPDNSFGLSPLGPHGDDLLVVDSSETDAQRLSGKLVAVYEPRDQEQWKAGSYVGWLHPLQLAGREIVFVGAVQSIDDMQNIASLDRFQRLKDVKGINALGLGSGIIAGLQGGLMIAVEGDSVILGRVVGWVSTDRGAQQQQTPAKKKKRNNATRVDGKR